MKKELSNAAVCSPNMSGLTEPEDPDYRVHAAWLAQASNAGDGLLAKEAGGSTSELTSSSAPPDSHRPSKDFGIGRGRQPTQ